jgi:hypothetical protein
MSDQETPPGGGPPELSFDDWATLSARLLKRTDRERTEILRERGLDAQAWKKVDDRFTRILADDIAEGDGELGTRYGAAFVAELEGRKAEAKVPPAPPPAPEPPAVEPEGSPAPPLQEAIPSYLRAESLDGGAPARPVARPPAHFAATLEHPSFAALAAARAEPMPFGDQPSPEFVASLQAPRRSSAANAFSGTLPLESDLRAQVKEALPFGKSTAEASQAAVTPQLTLESYASLCAELAVHPERAPEILPRYHLPDAVTRQAVDAAWQRRFAAHPDTQQRWSELCASYRAWLLRSPR